MLAQKGQQGVTLIELMIGIVIVSMLMALGVPAFSRMLQNSQVRSAAESLVNGLTAARNEALRLNSEVRFSITDNTGQVAWNITCVTETAVCPAGALQTRAANEGGGNARIGISTAASIPASDYSVALASGAGLTSGGGVKFTNLGTVNGIDGENDITRIDVTNSKDAGARRLVIMISPSGLIRMCDPMLNRSANPQGCVSS
jgi:type IV fimbrial biogenesis protein FimT